MLTILYTVGLVGALLPAVVASDPSYSSDCNKNEVSMLYNNVCLSDAKMQTQFQTFYIINIPSKALRKLSVLKSRQQAYAGAILLIVLQVSSRIVQSVLFSIRNHPVRWTKLFWIYILRQKNRNNQSGVNSFVIKPRDYQGKGTSPYIGLLPKVTLLKLFLGVEHSSVFRGCYSHDTLTAQAIFL